jgi:hypothetical protein
MVLTLRFAHTGMHQDLFSIHLLVLQVRRIFQQRVPSYTSGAGTLHTLIPVIGGSLTMKMVQQMDIIH